MLHSGFREALVISPTGVVPCIESGLLHGLIRKIVCVQIPHALSDSKLKVVQSQADSPCDSKASKLKQCATAQTSKQRTVGKERHQLADIITIRRVVRQMRGGSQSRLVEGEDGRFYIAKFAGNPQGNRTLINECVAHHLATRLGIPTPPLRILGLPEIVRQKDKLHFQVGGKTLDIEGSLHLGSQCVADPHKTAIFDFLPSKLLPKVLNLVDFAIVFLFDNWLGQADARQAIFIRERACNHGGVGFRGYFIDNGLIFSGKEWQFYDSPFLRLYADRSVYSMFDMQAACEQGLARIEGLGRADPCVLKADIPPRWFADGDHVAFATLMEIVEKRRIALRSLISITTCLSAIPPQMARPRRMS